MKHKTVSPATGGDEGGSSSSDYGIYIPSAVCRDRRLSPAARIVYGQVAQLAKTKGFCHANNKFLAEQCGVNRDTVSDAINSLVGQGLLTIERVSGRRRIRPVECGKSPPSPGAESGGDAAESIGEVRKTAEPPAENGRGHLNKSMNVTESNNNKRRESLSLLQIEDGRAAAVSVPASDQPTTPKSASAPSYDLQEAIAVTKSWAVQAASLMCRRAWNHRQADGTEKVWRLGMPSPGIPSEIELNQLANLALELWPGSEPIMALRQLLRAAAWTPERRETLQQYAFLSAGGTLTVRALLKVGGKSDPLVFARDAAGAVPPPPRPIVPGIPAEARVFRHLAYGTEWARPRPDWDACWLEAAGRCRAFNITPQIYMASVYDLFELGRKALPMPWLADSLSGGALMAFASKYGSDRRNAWRGGPCRRDPGDSQRSRRDYDSFCVGRDIAAAAAKGRKRFRSRSCLRCAAMELKLDPGLAEYVPWSEGAERLMDLLDGLAERTAQDDPPIRGVACGQEDCGPPSYLRCSYGSVRGVYSVGGIEDLLSNNGEEVIPTTNAETTP